MKQKEQEMISRADQSYLRPTPTIEDISNFVGELMKQSKQSGLRKQKVGKDSYTGQRLGSKVKGAPEGIGAHVSNSARVGVEKDTSAGLVDKFGDGKTYILKPMAAEKTLTIDISKPGLSPKGWIKHRKVKRTSLGRGVGPGSSRSRVLDRIKAIAADGDGPDRGTGCIVTDKQLPAVSRATTARGDGNVLAGYQIVQKG